MGLKEAVVFGKVVSKSRWFVLYVSFLIISFSGATYIFGLYSPAIKSALEYDQKTLNTLGFFKDLGANLGIISGLLNEVTPAWFVLAVGGVMNLTGFLLVWLSVTGRMAKPAKWQMFTYIAIGSNSQTFTNTGALVTCVKNFPQSRGIVLGILKGFAGLSGAIFTQIYHALYGNDPTSLILLIGWLPCLVCLSLMFIVRPMNPTPEFKELNRFYYFLFIALALAGFLMVVIIIQNHINFPPVGFKLVAASVVVFLVLPLGVVAKAEWDKVQAGLKPPAIELIEAGQANDKEDICTGSSPGDSGHNRIDTGLKGIDPGANGSADQSSLKAEEGKLGAERELSEAEQGENHQIQDTASSTPQVNFPRIEKNVPAVYNQPSKLEVCTDKPKAQAFSHKRVIQNLKEFWCVRPKRGDDFTIPQAMVSLDMWILFIASTCGIGAALTAVDNMGQIGHALGFSLVDVSTFVSLISIWNFLGRVTSGFCSELLLQKFSLPRPVILTFVLSLACIGHLFIAFALPGSLYVASVVLGFSFGAQWPVIFAMISELFGLKYYSTLYNLVGSASPLGTYLLSVRVAGYLYDVEAIKQNKIAEGSSAQAPAPHGNDLLCTGVSCFRLTFIIMTLVSLSGALISGFLVVRTRDFYKGDLYAKYQAPQQKDKSQSESHSKETSA
ncbi:hypothetical protein SUGI_0283150 [Cryptomeria japonica]|uniref:uncharacterized protein LOC131070368 n=1 Tax=Cryptomeria japonica TaxID=3369 RepID=UPI0024089EC3|nr:uncharacterized protein LOC131070368 [Cryptomeria japonica]GLJ16548.1 hypothetical protein SUGI_0283150 [Cryptomeria japonica]